MGLQKIEIYTKVDLNAARVTDHAIDRASTRFKMKDKSRTKVAEWIRNKLKNAEFKSTVSSERYGMGRLFLNGGVALVLDLYKDVVLTVYQIEATKRVKSKIYNYIYYECKRVSKLYNRKNKSYSRKIADLKVERAILERDLLRARKQERCMALQSRINAVDIGIGEMMQELSDLQVEISELEISLASLDK